MLCIVIVYFIYIYILCNFCCKKLPPEEGSCADILRHFKADLFLFEFVYYVYICIVKKELCIDRFNFISLFSAFGQTQSLHIFCKCMPGCFGISTIHHTPIHTALP